MSGDEISFSSADTPLKAEPGPEFKPVEQSELVRALQRAAAGTLRVADAHHLENRIHEQGLGVDEAVRREAGDLRERLSEVSSVADAFVRLMDDELGLGKRASHAGTPAERFDAIRDAVVDLFRPPAIDVVAVHGTKHPMVCITVDGVPRVTMLASWARGVGCKLIVAGEEGKG